MDRVTDAIDLNVPWICLWGPRPPFLCIHVYKARVYKFLILACIQSYNAQMCSYSVLRVTLMIVLLRLIMVNTFMAFKRDVRVFILPMFASYVPSLSTFFFYQDVDLKKKT